MRISYSRHHVDEKQEVRDTVRPLYHRKIENRRHEPGRWKTGSKKYVPCVEKLDKGRLENVLRSV